MYHPGGHQQEYGLDGRLYPMVMHGRHETAPEKICGVCGDRAKSLHFGGMACDSCKAFFRRSVQNEAYKHFRCAYERPCVITISSRKSCQSCRFRKCEEIGMEKSWVMTEEERTQQMKMRQEKKQQKQQGEERRRQSQEHRFSPHVAQLSQRHLYLSDEDVAEIELMHKTFYEKYETYPVPHSTSRPRCSRVVDVFINSIARTASYVTEFDMFHKLNQADQKILLKNGVLSMVILRGAMMYDEKDACFSLRATPKEDGVPSVGVNEIKGLLSADLYEKHQKFLQQMMSLHLDEKTLMLLQLVVLYSSERMGLTDPTTVGSFQEHYTNLVRKYMNWWYGEENTRLLYPRMLHRLADLRTLAESHTMGTVKFSEPDIGKVTEKFREIDINPYPGCPDFLQGLRVLQPSDAANRDPDRVTDQGRSGRSGSQIRMERPVHRANSMPGYWPGFGRAMPSGGGVQAAPLPAHAQYGLPGYPADVYCSSPQASNYARELPADWSPVYSEPDPGLSVWCSDQRLQRQSTPVSFIGAQECDFSSLLGLENRGEKRLKSEPNSPMISPTQSQQLLMAPHQSHMTSQDFVTSQEAAQHAMAPSHYAHGESQTSFTTFARQHSYDPATHGYSGASGGYHGNYSQMQ